MKYAKRKYTTHQSGRECCLDIADKSEIWKEVEVCPLGQSM
jgi:hypothetical protein